MDGLFWPVIVACLGVGGGPPCATHYAPAVLPYDCAATVVELKALWQTERGWCAPAAPAGATPLPDPAELPEGVVHAQAVPGPASCAPAAEIMAGLKGRYREAPVWEGVTIDGGRLLQLWVSPTPTWTLVATGTTGLSCIVAAGTGYQLDPPDPRIGLER